MPLLRRPAQDRHRDARCDLAQGAGKTSRNRGSGGRREEVFRKQVETEKLHGKVLEKKFDELLKQAKENPDVRPPTRDIDLD